MLKRIIIKQLKKILRRNRFIHRTHDKRLGRHPKRRTLRPSQLIDKLFMHHQSMAQTPKRTNRLLHSPKGHTKNMRLRRKTKELNAIISTSQDPQIVKVPGHYWHSFKVIGNETKSLTAPLNSVILENAQITCVDMLEESLIGKKAKVARNHKNGCLNLNVGDNSEIEI